MSDSALHDCPVPRPLPPALTQQQLPPVVIAASRIVPPFVPPPAAITDGRDRAPLDPFGIDPVWGRSKKPAAIADVLPLETAARPITAHGSADAVFGSRAEAERIARSLDQLAALFRSRGLAALQRTLRDPVAYAVLRAIAELPAAPAPPRSVAS